MSYVVELRQSEALDFGAAPGPDGELLVGVWNGILSWRDEFGADEFVRTEQSVFNRNRTSGRAKSLAAAQAGRKRIAYQRYFDETGNRWEVEQREEKLAKRLQERIDHAVKVLTNEGWTVTPPEGA